MNEKTRSQRESEDVNRERLQRAFSAIDKLQSVLKRTMEELNVKTEELESLKCGRAPIDAKHQLTFLSKQVDGYKSENVQLR